MQELVPGRSEEPSAHRLAKKTAYTDKRRIIGVHTDIRSLVPIAIDGRDLTPVMERHRGNEIFRQAINRVERLDLLLTLLSQFVYFNSVFGAGVAKLASELAHATKLFKDPDETIESIADRSSEVAAPIYFAAVDEFDRHKTHRFMAQRTLRAIAAYTGFSSTKLKRLTAITDATALATEKVPLGYCRNKDLQPADLFKGIGFHIGSEILAVTEFEILHNYLQSRQAKLVEHLVQANSYTWIAVHPVVEQDHFDAALEAATRALKYFPHKGQAKDWMLQGFENFSSVQEEFMNSLLAIASAKV